MHHALTAVTRRVVAGSLPGLLLLALSGFVHAQSAAPRVKFQTSQGDFVVELQPAKAPKTVENFLQYVADKHYEGTIFHRVIDGFMVQGGGFTAADGAKADPRAHPAGSQQRP